MEEVSNIYFIGIGGIGMSALARWFQKNGYTVAGYDRTPTLLTEQLQQEGIAIHFEDNIQLIPDVFFQHPQQSLIVYTPAIPKDHTEFNYFKDNGYNLQKRSQVLGMLTRNFLTIAVAGTHGKTTTSSMIAHILKASGKNCSAFLGGITQNYETNLLLNDPQSTETPMVVVEADEYDRSFLTLFPTIAVVTSVDPDHLDIYGNAEAMKTSYQEFINQVKEGGKIFIRQNLPLSLPAGKNVGIYGFSASSEAYYQACNIRIEGITFIFDIVSPAFSLQDIRLEMPGFHNVANALAATAAAVSVGVKPEDAKKALASYEGVKRRFEYIIKSDYLVYIDDYAHHPTEIEALITSVRALYPTKKISAVFQPHLFSRTRDFAEGFAASLSLADQVILLDIYPARELPIAGVTSEIILERITSPEKILCSKNKLLDLLNKSSVEVLLTIGAGDIDQLIQPIKEYFNQQSKVIS